MKPTIKQEAYVKRITDRLGRSEVEEYVRYFWKDADIDNLTREQAQKIITGLSHRIAKPIYGVVGRDIPFSR